MIYGLSRFSQGDHHSGFLFTLNSRVKLLFVFCWSVLVVLLDTRCSLSALFAVSCVILVFTHTGRRKLLWLAVMIAIITWGVMFSQALFYYHVPRTVLLTIIDPETPILGKLTGGLFLYREGIQYGAVQSLRFSSMLLIGLSLCWTTDSRQMLRGMTALRMPYIAAFMTVTALRLLPAIIDEFGMVVLAHRMRGGRLFHWNPVSIVVSWMKITRAVVINSYRRSNTLALSIQSRAFQPGGSERHDVVQCLSPREKALAGVCIAGTTALAITKIVYWLYLGNVLYLTQLRPLYEFSRHYL